MYLLKMCSLSCFFIYLFLLQKEWLCLNCQTQKAMSSQLGDVPPPSMASTLKQSPAPPTPLSSPAPAAIDSKPVVEAVDPSPPTSKAKVVPQTTLDSTPISPEYMPSSLENSSQEAPQSEESMQPFVDGSVTENYSENKPLNSESSAESNTVEHQQINSEEKTENTEPSESNQQTQKSTVSEIPAVGQQQSSSEKAAEDQSFHDTETSSVKQQEQSAIVSKIQAVQQLQSSSGKMPENCFSFVESNKQTQLTNTDLDKTTACITVDTKQDIEITQSEGGTPSANHKKVGPSSEKLPEVTTNSVEQTIEEPLIEKPPEQTPSTRLENALDINQTRISKKLEEDAVKSDVTNTITENVMSKIKPLSSVGFTDKADTPECNRTDQEFQPKTTKCAESESCPALAKGRSVLASEVLLQTNETGNKPTEKEMIPKTHNIVKITPAVVLLEEDSKVLEKAQEENTFKNTDPLKVIDNRETTKEKIPRGGDEEGSLHCKINVGAPEVKANKGDNLEERGIKQNPIRNTNDPKLLDIGGNKAGTSEAVASSDTANTWLPMERNELETSEEPVAGVLEQVPKYVVQLNKKTQPETKSTEPTENSHVENVSLVRKDKVLLKNEQQTVEEPMLKLDEKFDKAVVISDPPPLTPTEQEKVDVEVPVRSIELVSASAVLSETKLRDKTCEEKHSLGEAEAGSQTTSSAAENQNEPQKNSELSVKAREAENDKKEDDSQFLVGNNLKFISVSEASAECHKNGTLSFDVGVSAASKKGEVSEGPPVLVPVAKPKIQSVVSEQDEGPNEGKEKIMETKAKPLEKHSEEISKVTLVLS